MNEYTFPKSIHSPASKLGGCTLCQDCLLCSTLGASPRRVGKSRLVSSSGSPNWQHPEPILTATPQLRFPQRGDETGGHRWCPRHGLGFDSWFCCRGRIRGHSSRRAFWYFGLSFLCWLHFNIGLSSRRACFCLR